MSDRISLVTGGTGGLGRAVVPRLLQRGDRVVVPWFVEAEADALRELVSGSTGDGMADAADRLELLPVDLTDPEEIKKLSDWLGELGGLDVLVNLAGGFSMNPVEETAPEEWEKMISLNATSLFLAVRALVPQLRASGRGRIVNIAAVPAVTGGGAGMVAYTASKAAVVAMTKAMASEFGDGITVNALAPTTIDTPANREAMPDADPSDWVKGEEMAELIDYLTGEAGRSVNGNVIVMGR